MPKTRHTPHRYRFLMFGRSDHEDLIHQIHYLSVENRILRSKLPRRVSLTNKERRRLLRFGKPIGEQLRHLITIVQYPTFQRWVRGAGSIRRKRSIKKVGRPPTARHLKDLVLRIAKTPGAGYTRILGELRKLGIGSISRTTVRSILKEHGIEPAPDRAEPVWDTFLKRHAATLWSCDYFTKEVLTIKGFKRYTVLAFMHIKSRKVIVTKATLHPTRGWVSDVAECLTGAAKTAGLPTPSILIRDNDGKFGPEFDDALRGAGITPMHLPVRAPSMNAHIERWIKSIKIECLDHFLPIGAKHLDYLVGEYLEHYHTERPHQGLGNKPLSGDEPTVVGEIKCNTRLGGVLHHYYRAA